MRIIDLISEELVVLGSSVSTKTDAIDLMISLLEKSGSIAEQSAFRLDVLERESLVSTDFGEGIAIPHAQSLAVCSPAVAAITLSSPLKSMAIDGIPTSLMFMIAAPKDDIVHFEILAKLAELLIKDDTGNRLRKAKSTSEFINILNQ